MSTAIEPKKVLQLINSMGYKNVSANELKDFTRDLKKLMKYEQRTKSVAQTRPQVIHAPENVINVTVVKEVRPTTADAQPTLRAKNPVDEEKENNSERVKQSKRLLRLPHHIRAKNAVILYKKGKSQKGGVLVRNTPTDLFKKYQDDWQKFKSMIPGENPRTDLRNSIRKKMKQKEDMPDKVYVHFPDETGDH